MEYPRVVTASDGAGVVDHVGTMVPQSWVGRRVWLYNGQRNGRWMGTAAEYIALNVDLVTPNCRSTCPSPRVRRSASPA